MPHFARMFFVAFLLTATGCSQIAQKEDDRKEAERQLTEPTTPVYAHHSHLSDRQWSIATWQSIRPLQFAAPKKGSFRRSKMRFRKAREKQFHLGAPQQTERRALAGIENPPAWWTVGS